MAHLLSFALGDLRCHTERSEESRGSAHQARYFAALRMTGTALLDLLKQVSFSLCKHMRKREITSTIKKVVTTLPPQHCYVTLAARYKCRHLTGVGSNLMV